VFRCHPDLEWRAECDPSSTPPGIFADQGQPGSFDRGSPLGGDLPLRARQTSVTGHDETPALAGLGGRIWRRRHVC
jgi:hypothetical protein